MLRKFNIVDLYIIYRVCSVKIVKFCLPKRKRLSFSLLDVPSSVRKGFIAWNMEFL